MHLARSRIVLNMIRAKIGRAVTVEAAADEVDVLEEAWNEPAPPVHVLPGAFDRVTAGVPGHSTASEELARATDDTFGHRALIRYRLSDCLVHETGIDYPGGYFSISGDRRARLNVGETEPIEAMTYCMSGVSRTFFGHWLSDACATALLATSPETVLLDLRADWPDTADYACAFGLNATHLFAARVSTLTMFEDRSQGQSKRRRYAQLKARLRDACGGGDPQHPVYFRRGATGVARRIADEDALCDTLADHGFDIVDVEGPDFAERHRRLAAASLVVTIDGSHNNHAYFSVAAGTPIIILNPADRFTSVGRGIAHAMDLPYGMVVAQPSQTGYHVDANDILRTADLMMGGS